MKLISLFLVFVFTTGCVWTTEDESQFRGQRDKLKKPKVRSTLGEKTDIVATPSHPPVAPKPSAPAPSAESLIFPLIPSASHSSFLLKSSDHKKISFSAKPDTHPLSLIAGLSGTVSLNTQNGVHYLSLTPSQSSKILHFELSEEGTTVETSNQAQVTQGQVLMKSNQPIVFYITENSETNLLCINTTQLETVLTVTKELPDTEDCEK
ncbi:MAG: hypothetical protein OXJ52_06990 [Oligoflexia bacterium]|nr:hypothetical protein [Oligoflexia bacterium]